MSTTSRYPKVLFATFSLLLANLCAAGEDPAFSWTSPLVPDTEEATCEILKATVVKQHHLPADTPQNWNWYCDFSTEEYPYLRLVALRAKECDAFSCLMGWFAVMRRSTVVLEWDLAEDRLVPLSEFPK
jgi:hypothetical protein